MVFFFPLQLILSQALILSLSGRALTPRLGTTDNYSYKSEIPLTHWCICINNFTQVADFMLNERFTFNTLSKFSS